MSQKYVGIASDHAGLELKRVLSAELDKRGFEVKDLGTHENVSCDYPDFAHVLARAVEAVATALALGRAVAPPTVGWEQREDDLELDYVPDSGRRLERNGRPAVALSNSFGFGGHNAVLCLETA